MSQTLANNFCQCNRRITRAFQRAIHEGDHCPTCFLRIKPDRGSQLSADSKNVNDVEDIHINVAPQSPFDSFDSTSDYNSPIPQYVNLRDFRGRLRFSTSSDDSDSASSRVSHQYDSIHSGQQSPPLHVPMADGDLAGALRLLANNMGHTGKFNHPLFTGEKDQNIETFLNKFDRFCEINNKNVDYKLQSFPLLLEGRAYILYQDLPDETKQDYDMLTENMKQYFASTELPPLHAYETLYTQKMTKADTVQKFFEKILDKSKKLNITPEQKTALFISGLTKNIKKYVITEKPETLAAALTKAKEAELLNLENDEESKLLQTILAKLEQPTPATIWL